MTLINQKNTLKVQIVRSKGQRWLLNRETFILAETLANPTDDACQ